MSDAPVVLLIDDEPVLLRLLEINMRSAGFEVRTAGSGEAAVVSATTRRPDVVVLDLGLPDLGGWETLRRLRAFAGVTEAPVIVLSGLDRDAAGDPGYAAGVYAFLVKPIEPTDLVQTVRRALAERDG
ncbi:MAG TPA: response regulator [Actinomycetota bacterium]|nr:response regulator [Actinomycetota bacterium]